jgi:hypothetical protein
MTMLQINRISPFPDIQNSSSCRYTIVFFSVLELRTTDLYPDWITLGYCEMKLGYSSKNKKINNKYILIPMEILRQIYCVI